FCLSEVKIGLIPAVISPYVIAAIGERQARRYFLTAEEFDGQQAQQMGLVHQLADDPTAADKLKDQWLQQLLNNGPAAVSAAKQLILDISGRKTDPQLMQETAQRIADIRISDEGQEGLSAFLNKRKPSWLPTSDT
ncbi:MAG: enoyl-CoA hydratase-related protein, partial [Motiliproteus sp.]